MTTVRQILRYTRRLNQIESGAKILNRSARCASTQAQRKIIADENGKKFFPSPFGEFTPQDMLIHEYIWQKVDKFSNKTALVCAVTGRKYTYGEMRDAANYSSRSLLKMGLKKGDVVALVAPNYPETIISFLSILNVDLVVTTVNPYYTPHEIGRQLKDSGAKAVITVAEIARGVQEAAKNSIPSGSPFVVIEDGTGPIPKDTVPFKDLIERGKSLPPFKSSESSVNELAILPYSSGTTGLPKGVMLTHRNIVSNMQMVEQTGNGQMWREADGDFQEVLPIVLPFFHIFGMNVIGLPRLAAGTQLITVPKFTPELFTSVLAKYKSTGLFVVPPIVLFLNASPHLKREYFDSMHHIFSGAAPLSQADVDRFYDKFKTDTSKVKFCQGYGMTETSPVICMETTGLKPGSIGKNVAGCDLRLVDPYTDTDISRPGQTGELWVRGPHIMKGYLNNDDATREIMENGWLKTGDIAYYDEEYDFFVTDRLKELIKVKAFQVAPAELEALLRTHPDVQEAGVVGVPNERCGEVPRAYIVLRKGSKATEEEMKNFVKGKVSDYKELQGGVKFVDSIPKNASGKILRTQLKNQYK